MTASSAIQSTRETTGAGYNGAIFVPVAFAFFLLAFGFLTHFGAGGKPGVFNGLCAALSILGGALTLAGFYTIQPNTARVFTLFGRYAGTDRATAGLRWKPIWYTRTRMSLRVRNVTCEKLKVNDKQGNPIEIAANVVWRIADTAQALYDVENYGQFVNIQIETGLRAIASAHAYDHGVGDEPTLRAAGEQVAELLREELQERVAVAGIVIDDARISHLAYAPEIAGAMLRRQQAQAVLEARRLIVEGAVGMVEHALEQLGERGVVTLDEERKAAMVSNLLVVLCSDRDAQPVLNTGTLYA